MNKRKWKHAPRLREESEEEFRDRIASMSSLGPDAVMCVDCGSFHESMDCPRCGSERWEAIQDLLTRRKE